jgi:hypothetical protein
MSKELIELLAKEQGLRRYSGIFSDEYIVRAHELEAFAKAYQAAAPIDNGKLLNELIEQAQPLETIEYWANEHAKDPYKTGGGMTVKLIREYLAIRKALIPDTQAYQAQTQGQSETVAAWVAIKMAKLAYEDLGMSTPSNIYVNNLMKRAINTPAAPIAVDADAERK